MSKINESELIQNISDSLGYPVEDVIMIINQFKDSIKAELHYGNEVGLLNFGKYYLVDKGSFVIIKFKPTESMKGEFRR